jgi:hypothetical protein
MKKNNIFLLLIFFVVTNNLVAQDGMFWEHDITFQFEDFKNNKRGASIVGVEFLINDAFICQNSKRTRLTLNTNSIDSTIFRIVYNYIGVGSSPSKIKCPDIFLRLTLEVNKVKYEKLIPFIFITTNGPFHSTIINKINLNKYIDHYSEAVVIIVDGDGSYTMVEQSSMKEKLIIKTLVTIPITDLKTK